MSLPPAARTRRPSAVELALRRADRAVRRILREERVERHGAPTDTAPAARRRTTQR